MYDELGRNLQVGDHVTWNGSRSGSVVDIDRDAEPGFVYVLLFGDPHWCRIGRTERVQVRDDADA